MSLVFSGDPLIGSNFVDNFIIDYDLDGAATRILGNVLDDVIIADMEAFFYTTSVGRTLGSGAILTNFTDFWSVDVNPDILNSPLVPHTTVYGSGVTGETDFYRLQVVQGQAITLDIDYGLHEIGTDLFAVIEIYDPNGVLVASSSGNSTGLPDSGSTSTADPFLDHVFATTGLYSIRVGVAGPGGIQTFAGGEDYLLNISLQGQSFTGSEAGGNDTIEASLGNDVIYGMGGDDEIVGGEGNELIDGGSGNDLIVINHNDLGTMETIRGGSGTDTVHFVTGVRRDIPFLLSTVQLSSIERLSFDQGVASGYTARVLVASSQLGGGLAGNLQITFDTNDYTTEVVEFFLDTLGQFSLANLSFDAVGDFDRIDVTGTNQDDNVIGSVIGDVIQGFDGDDQLDGSGGNDVLNGGAGNDVLRGGSGRDVMEGGSGNDRYWVDAVNDDVIETGTDTGDAVYSETDIFSLVGLSAIENLIGVLGTGQSLTGHSQANAIYAGSGNDSIFGLGGQDTIFGGGGDDIIDGGAGVDSMNGGSGNDTYVIDEQLEIVGEVGGQGTDGIVTALSTFSLQFAPNIENLQGLFAGGHSFTGSDLANRIGGWTGHDMITGGNGNDTLEGLGGNDSLYGGIENDVLSGGAGNDLMEGGSGNDQYWVDSLSDVVNETGADTGDQLYTGIATFSMAAIAGVEDLLGLAATGQTLTGNGLNNRVFGNTGNDTLNGGGGVDSLYGGGGNDVLAGGIGDDLMAGGTGNDQYWIDTAGDTVTEQANGGTADQIYVGLASYSIAATAHVENLVGTAATDQTLTGNTLHNRIVGNTGNDTLNGGGGNDSIYGGGGNDVLGGGAGNDLMSGGVGNDSYWVDAAGDQVVEGAGEGTADMVYSTLATASINALSQIEHLTGASTTGQVLEGNAGGNLIWANTGNDQIYALGGNDSLYGNGGNDFLFGGTGNDTMFGGSGADTFVFNSALGATNVDRISDFVVVDDTIRLDDAIFTAVGAPLTTLAAGAFGLGNAATTAAQRILYDSATGNLFHDADGTAGGTGPVLFATLTPGLALTHADFFII